MHKGVNVGQNFCSLTLKSKRKMVLPLCVLWVPFKPGETGAGCGAVQATQSERKSAVPFSLSIWLPAFALHWNHCKYASSLHLASNMSDGALSSLSQGVGSCLSLAARQRPRALKTQRGFLFWHFSGLSFHPHTGTSRAVWPTQIYSCCLLLQVQCSTPGSHWRHERQSSA